MCWMQLLYITYHGICIQVSKYDCLLKDSGDFTFLTTAYE